MNKIINLMLCAVLTALCLACNNTTHNEKFENEIKEQVRIWNLACPLDYGNKCCMTSVVYDNNEIIYNYTIDISESKVEEAINTAIKQLPNLKAAMLSGLKIEAEMSPDAHRIYENIVKTGSKMVYKYYSKSGTPMYSIELSNDEIKQRIL